MENARTTDYLQMWCHCRKRPPRDPDEAIDCFTVGFDPSFKYQDFNVNIETQSR
jgi:hypothetical protein